MQRSCTRHRPSQVRVPQEQFKLLSQFSIRFYQEPALSIQHVIRSIQIHCNTRKAACAGLPEHLRMAFENTGEQEHVGVAHFAAELCRCQLAQEFDVAATELLRQGEASCFGLSAPGESKLHMGKTSRLLDDQLHAFARLKRSRS